MSTRRSRLIAAIAVLFALSAVFPAGIFAQRLVETSDPSHPKVKYADSLVSLNDRCIVAGSKLSTTIRPVYVSNAPIGFCCTRCPNVFVKEPEHYLSFREVEVPCAVRPSRTAQLIPALRTRLNHEIFYFSSAEARDRFLKDPFRYCGYLTDPISKVRFRPEATSPRMEFGGRTYYFESDSTLARFKAEPEAHADRTGA
jgi:YHS domain-containing protein